MRDKGKGVTVEKQFPDRQHQAYYDQMIVRFIVPFRIKSSFPDGWNVRTLSESDLLHSANRKTFACAPCRLKATGFT